MPGAWPCGQRAALARGAAALYDPTVRASDADLTGTAAPSDLDHAGALPGCQGISTAPAGRATGSDGGPKPLQRCVHDSEIALTRKIGSEGRWGAPCRAAPCALPARWRGRGRPSTSPGRGCAAVRRSVRTPGSLLPMHRQAGRRRLAGGHGRGHRLHNRLARQTRPRTFLRVLGISAFPS